MIGRRKRTGNSRRLSLEVLESRLAPANYTWNGGGTTNFWDDVGNWGGGGAPGAGDSATFNATSNKPAIVRNATEVSQVTISNYGGNLKLEANLDVTGGVDQNGSIIEVTAGKQLAVKDFQANGGAVVGA